MVKKKFKKKKKYWLFGTNLSKHGIFGQKQKK